MELAGLRVDEVGRELAGIAAEQHVGQRHVAPVEAGQVQAHQQHGDRVDEGRHVLGGHAAAEQAPVGQRELEVLRDQCRRQVIAAAVHATKSQRFRDGLATPVAGGDTVSIIPAVAGG